MKWIIRILIVLILIFAIFFLLLQCSGNSCVQRIDQMPPDAKKAAWETPTHSKIYYSEKADLQTNGDVILYNWYEPVGKKWVFHPGYETLPKAIYGTMKPKRR